MATIGLEIAILLLLIFVNGLLAMSEIALVSARKALLLVRANDGDTGAEQALDLIDEPNRFLATVQIGITSVGILAGAFGGATLAEPIAAWLRGFPLLAPFAETVSVVTVVLIITYLTLVLGELAPKRIALIDAESTAIRVAPTMQRLSRLTQPIVHLLEASTRAVLRVLRINEEDTKPVSDEEIEGLLQSGAELGVFEPIEEEIVRQLFRLSDQSVAAHLTPRAEIAWLDPQDSTTTIRNKIIATDHSRFPVARGNLDHVIGQVLVKDLSGQEWQGDPFDLETALRPVLFVPATAPALTVLEQFRSEESKLAMIIDEFGGVLGMVTVRDLVEAIVGELPETDEEMELEAIKRADGSWLLDGMYPLAEFQDLFHLGDVPEEFKGHYHTVGGLVIAKLERMPMVGDTFEWCGLRIEVLDMDGQRVDRVLATKFDS